MDTLKTLSLVVAALLFAGSIWAAEPAQPDPNQALFDEAMDKRDSGRLFDAIEIFETLLKNQPDLGRVRLELAVAYHRASQYEEALKEFNAVLENEETPESVRLSILAYLAQLKKDRETPHAKHQLSYYVKLGALNNSNINSTPGSNANLFAATPDKIDSAGLDITLAALHNYSLSSPLNVGGTDTRFEWSSQLAASDTSYDKDSNYDLRILSFSTGPTFYSPGRWRALANIKLDQIELGGSSLATFTSFNPAITFDFGHFRSMTLETSVTSHDYDDVANKSRNGEEKMFGGGYTTFLSESNTGLEAGIRIYSNDADVLEFAYDRQELFFSGYTSVFESAGVYLKLNTAQYEYKGIDTASGSGLIRDETENQASIGYNHDFVSGWLKNWNLNTEIAVIKNNSNVSLYEYDRTLLSVHASRYFK